MVGPCGGRECHAQDLHELLLGGPAAEGEGPPEVDDLHRHQPGLQGHQQRHLLLVVVALQDRGKQRCTEYRIALKIGRSKNSRIAVFERFVDIICSKTPHLCTNEFMGGACLSN